GCCQRMLLVPTEVSPLGRYTLECQDPRKKNRSGCPPQVSIVHARLAVYSPAPMIGQGLACESRLVSMPNASQFSTTMAAARFITGFDSGFMLIRGTLKGEPSGRAHLPSILCMPASSIS